MNRFASSISLVTALALVACGSKNDLRGGGPRPPQDGGTMSDASAPGVLAVDCGRRERFTAPHRPLTVTASASSESGITDQTWSVASSPAGTMPTLDAIGGAATLNPPAAGDYALRFTARDGEGHSGTCTVTVHALVGAPVAICPDMPMFRTPAHVPVRIEGDAFDDVAVVSAV